MKKIIIAMLIVIGTSVGVAGALIGFLLSRPPQNLTPENISQGVALDRDALDQRETDLAKLITSAPVKSMKQSGLAAAMGGIRLKLTSKAPQEVVVPIPQLADAQAPICYFIRATPADAVRDIRIRKREDSNVVVGVKLVGDGKEVQLEWSSVILLAQSRFPQIARQRRLSGRRAPAPIGLERNLEAGQ